MLELGLLITDGAALAPAVILPILDLAKGRVDDVVRDVMLCPILRIGGYRAMHICMIMSAICVSRWWLSEP